MASGSFANTRRVKAKPASKGSVGLATGPQLQPQLPNKKNIGSLDDSSTQQGTVDVAVRDQLEPVQDPQDPAHGANPAPELQAEGEGRKSLREVAPSPWQFAGDVDAGSLGQAEPGLMEMKQDQSLLEAFHKPEASTDKHESDEAETAALKTSLPEEPWNESEQGQRRQVNQTAASQAALIGQVLSESADHPSIKSLSAAMVDDQHAGSKLVSQSPEEEFVERGFEEQLGEPQSLLEPSSSIANSSKQHGGLCNQACSGSGFAFNSVSDEALLFNSHAIDPVASLEVDVVSSARHLFIRAPFPQKTLTYGLQSYS